ncbi:alpha/beta hydrolase family protein [Alkaliphilus peptidifermentans]|uniref:Dipeptidyl aminopeptidase/acylaminoacyl peptidase n=1 Tax=Alkaliphilus peptidifermentans DSM 18978 TaxID=1120976 RepID=A0A1G5EMC4_9FIRM|nr:S9 family peptidase [Alkaliphilus peptidifermentans]SCY27941.1 Dipeptidyl aminopeptidase/acylaminoacyl peptidase [Alkaliphilus peptidifermentans DSM 18978]
MKRIFNDDFINYKFLSGVKYSPDGKNACFVLHEAHMEENCYNSNLWIYKEGEDRYFQLTSNNKEKSFLWLDNETILFEGSRNPKDKEKKEAGEELSRFYRINIYGGEALEAFVIPYKITSFKHIKDSVYLFTATFNPNKKPLHTLHKEDKEKEVRLIKEEKDYEGIDEIPFWSNGEGYTNKNRNRLYMYDSSDEKIIAITDETVDVEDYQIDNNKDKVIITASNFLNKREVKNHLLIWSPSSNAVKRIVSDEAFQYGTGYFISEDTIICTGSDMKEYGLNQNSKFYLININTEEKSCITPKFDISTWNSVGSDCRYGASSTSQINGNLLYFITTEGDSSFLNTIDQEGDIQQISTAKGSIDGFDAYGDKILFIGLREQHLQELYRLDKGTEERITCFNEEPLKGKYVAKPELIRVTTAPGVEMDGWVIKPINFNENIKYPAILNIHGGPKTVYGEVFHHEMQYWASEGYVVFFCNPRGSDGKGNEFADIRGKYGTIDYEDIMKFTDAVLEKCSYIDKEKIGVTGGSYGGFMTNWIIGHTDRFKAAVSQRGISNWTTMFTTSDIGYYFESDQIAATPWKNHDKLWWHSPLKYADKVKTPTLFIHSEEDYRCWWVEAIQMFTALKYHNIESRLYMFRGENHELSRSGKPKHRSRRLKEITDWFNRYLK